MAQGCPMMNPKKATDHPCFGGDHAKTGRIHLPVAPGCNIKCGFCERRFDCANESRPGVTSRLLTPEQGLQRVKLLLRHPKVGQNLKVVGIAGPGDPLYNDQTFRTFELIRTALPEMHLCLSTNGLLLPERINEVLDVGVHSITVTVNALTAETGAKVYNWVRYAGHRLTGEEAARVLLDAQFEGIRLAAEAGCLVKVNHVYMPGINDHETLDLALKARELGADVMNVLPLIPCGDFRGETPPSDATMEMVRDQCELILSQARHCKACRADAAGMIGDDLDLAELDASGTA